MISGIGFKTALVLKIETLSFKCLFKRCIFVVVYKLIVLEARLNFEMQL